MSLKVWKIICVASVSVFVLRYTTCIVSRMVSFTPPAPKLATTQKFGRQPARGPIRGFLNMWKTILTDFHYPKAVLVNFGILALFAIPLIRREGWYQHDAKKGAPWDRILAEREKLAKESHLL